MLIKGVDSLHVLGTFVCACVRACVCACEVKVKETRFAMTILSAVDCVESVGDKSYYCTN